MHTHLKIFSEQVSADFRNERRADLLDQLFESLSPVAILQPGRLTILEYVPKNQQILLQRLDELGGWGLDI